MAQGIRYLEMSHPGLVNELQGNLQVVKDLFFLVGWDLRKREEGASLPTKPLPPCWNTRPP